MGGVVWQSNVAEQQWDYMALGDVGCREQSARAVTLKLGTGDAGAVQRRAEQAEHAAQHSAPRRPCGRAAPPVWQQRTPAGARWRRRPCQTAGRTHRGSVGSRPAGVIGWIGWTGGRPGLVGWTGGQQRLPQQGSCRQRMGLPVRMLPVGAALTCSRGKSAGTAGIERQERRGRERPWRARRGAGARLEEVGAQLLGFLHRAAVGSGKSRQGGRGRAAGRHRPPRGLRAEQGARGPQAMHVPAQRQPAGLILQGGCWQQHQQHQQWARALPARQPAVLRWHCSPPPPTAHPHPTPSTHTQTPPAIAPWRGVRGSQKQRQGRRPACSRRSSRHASRTAPPAGALSESGCPSWGRWKERPAGRWPSMAPQAHPCGMERGGGVAAAGIRRG